MPNFEDKIMKVRRGGSKEKKKTRSGKKKKAFKDQTNSNKK